MSVCCMLNEPYVPACAVASGMTFSSTYCAALKRLERIGVEWGWRQWRSYRRRSVVMHLFSIRNHYLEQSSTTLVDALICAKSPRRWMPIQWSRLL